MSLIAATNLKKAYGAQDVFENVSVAIPHQSRIALMGANGIGKTTLLRLLSGQDRPDHGTVQRARKLRIGYLPQESSFSHSYKGSLSQTLWELGLGAFAKLRDQELELAQLEQTMADPEKAESAISRYGGLQESFESEGGYTYTSRIQRVFNGLGFKPEEYGRTLDQLSGGERTRALIATLLLEDPDLLLLDEPTNHLDIGAVEWLEGWFREWTGAVVVVSHDRYFLDNAVELVWELSPHGVEVYRGNYSSYVNQRVERSEYQRARFLAQQEHIKKEQEFIRRNIAGQKTRQAQGRRKRLKRLLREEAIPRPETDRSVRINFGDVARSGDRVLETADLVIGYPDSGDPLFQVPDLILMRGECVALIGPNGAGKTTFLKTLLGGVKPLEGKVRMGSSLRVGYFAQAHEGLRSERTVLEEILATDPGLKVSEARNLLARFLFAGDTVNKRIEVISGGERGRVALAKLALEGANLLLLDEPTNHLDIPSQEILEETLINFPGTIILVSHDRYLIDSLSTQVWVISPSERSLAVYQGGYAVYLEGRRRKAEVRKTRRRTTPKRSGAGMAVSKTKVEEIEGSIDALEDELTQIGMALEQAGTNIEDVRRLGRRYAELEADLEAQLTVWEDLVDEDS